MIDSFVSIDHAELGGLVAGWLKGAGVMVLGWLVARLVSRAARAAMERAHVKPDLRFFLDSLLYYGTLVIVGVAALSEMGVDTNSFMAVLGAAAIAVGLGLKDQLAQLTAGIVLLIKHPFQVGDVIQIAGQTGKVKSIEFFQTTLTTADNKRITLPNSVVMSGVITNFSSYPTRRADISVSIEYKDDISVARQVLLDVAANEPMVLADPEPKVLVSNLGDHGVELQLRAWVQRADFLSAGSALKESCKVELEKAGCSIPFPQLVVHSEN